MLFIFIPNKQKHTSILKDECQNKQHLNDQHDIGILSTICWCIFWTEDYNSETSSIHIILRGIYLCFSFNNSKLLNFKITFCCSCGIGQLVKRSEETMVALITVDVQIFKWNLVTKWEAISYGNSGRFV